MACFAQKLADIQIEENDFKHVKNGIDEAKRGSIIGENMSAEGYNVMDLVEKWVKRKLHKISIEKVKLSDINLV